MNHLAHFFLSGNNEEIILGNFIADFISNKEVSIHTEGVRKGIRLHRIIDAFTDSHEVVKQSTKRLHYYHHKYSPVIVDIYYDFLLAKNWDIYAPHTHLTGVSVRQFTLNMYDLLRINEYRLPRQLLERLDRMIGDDWLMKYTTYEGLNLAFRRIEKHAAFPGNFGNAAHHLELFLPDFDREFNLFFPDLKDHINIALEKMSKPNWHF